MANRNFTAPSPSALLFEAMTPLQLPALLLRAPLLGLAPRGHGEQVLVLPGFGASNASTLVLRQYLNWLGYRARGWTQGRNNGDVLRLLDEVADEVGRMAADGPVRLVGWSLGGYIAREVARDHPEWVERVVTMGSPVVGGPKYTTVARAFTGAERGASLAAAEALDAIEALVDARYTVPLKVPVTAIYSKFDGVVAWQACLDDRSPNVEHVEVVSSHVGLGFNADVLSIMASRLAQTVAAAA